MPVCFFDKCTVGVGLKTLMLLRTPPKHPAPSFPDWKSMPARTEMQISGAAGKDWHPPVFDGILFAILANPDKQAGGALTGPKHSGSAPHRVLLNQPSEHTTESQPLTEATAVSPPSANLSISATPLSAMGENGPAGSAPGYF